jgi:hypothetical protein
MKRLITTMILATLTATISTAQTFQENFLGEDFMQYNGALVKLKDDAITGFRHTFYSDLKYCQKMYDNNVIYPDTKYNFTTVKDSLKNRIFKVENIVSKDGITFTGGSYLDKPILVLKDTLNNQVIYYMYDTQYEHNFPFLTSRIELDTAALCSKIERRVDDFTDKVSLNSPIIESRKLAPMTIYKSIEGIRTVYYLSLRTYGRTANVGESGVIILFDDGTKMNKPSEEIDIDTDDRGFEYSAFIALTETEVQLLTTKKIKKFRLYIYDEEVNPGEANKFTHYVKCVIEKK